jgi:16S rRNA (guanine527-N7)-methyltransferase
MHPVDKYFSDFTPAQQAQLDRLKALYEDWNAKINVISRKDMENFYERHVLHSLAITTTFEFPAGSSVMDLGCGGGFPGIPLAIFFPEVQFHLVDSINKKLNVVRSIAGELGLTNVTTRHSRAEDIKDKKFNAIVSRAVAPLKDLWYWSKPLLLKQSGMKANGLICLKGGDLNQEIVESGVQPKVWQLSQFFEEEFFQEKSMLFVPALPF